MIVYLSSSGGVGHVGEYHGHAVLVAGVDRCHGRFAVAEALEPVEEVVGTLDQLHRRLFSQRPALLDRSGPGGERFETVGEVENTLAAVHGGAASGAVAEVRHVAGHEPLGIDERGLDVVGAVEPVVVDPGKRSTLGDRAGGKLGPGHVVHQVDEVAHESADRSAGEVAVAVPAGEAAAVERALRQVGEELVPVDLRSLDILLHPLVPVGLGHVSHLLDPGDFSEHPGFVEGFGADHAGIASALGAHLYDDTGPLDCVAGALEFVEVHCQRLLDVCIFAGCRGRLQVGAVLVVAGGDHHGVDVVLIQQLAIRGELPGRAAVPLADLGGRLLAMPRPDVADRREFHVLGLVVGVHARHVDVTAATTAADLPDRDPLVGPYYTTVACGRDCHAGRTGSHLEKLPAGWNRRTSHGRSPG